MVMVVERKRVQSTLDELRGILAVLEEEAVCLFTPLRAEDVLGSAALSAIPDIFDRLIVYEAVKHNAILITRDAAIAQTGLVQTLW